MADEAVSDEDHTRLVRILRHDLEQKRAAIKHLEALGIIQPMTARHLQNLRVEAESLERKIYDLVEDKEIEKTLTISDVE
jgi:hypothetical protein